MTGFGIKDKHKRTKEYYGIFRAIYIPLSFFLYSLLLPTPAYAIQKNKLTLLRRIHTYGATIDTSNVFSSTSYAYTRANIRVEKRNFALKLVPSAYVVTRGKERDFLTEAYSKVKIWGLDDYKVEPLLRITTIPHRKRPMPNFAKYLTPDIYDETIVANTLLSPFHPNNFRFYSYNIGAIHGDTIYIRFKPKRQSTQLVRGSAKADQLTGRIIDVNFRGEFDMTRFWISMKMNQHGFASLFPAKCEGLFLFSFCGNKVSGHYKSYMGLPKVLDDNIDKGNEAKLMDIVRPDTLSDMERNIYARKMEKTHNDSLRAAQDTTKHSRNFVKDVLWDVVGDNVLNRVKSNFGMNNRGYVRLNPVLNPLYMGYDHRRGFTYKIDVRASYQLGDNSEISGRFRGGYAFKQEQFYFRLPIYYYFNKSKNGYVKFEIGNGNHISNQSVRRDIIKNHIITPLQIDTDLLNDFKQTDTRLLFNYDVNSVFGFQVGALYQLRRAVNRQAFHLLGWKAYYSSFAPIVEIQVRPWGWNGPIFSANYDRAIKGMLKTNTSYERVEANAEYIHHINRLQSIQARFGGGFYTMRGKRAYFLNYENFRENNIPGGWNDDWSGEFELLRSDTYNTSDYYVRANFTYESPLLLLSWLPLIGHYMEMERIYVSALDVSAIHPYVEFGYGFTTRLFSMGLFVSSGQGNRSVGCKFGFELFRKW